LDEPVPLTIAPPKYAVLVNTIQERIAGGAYAPGSKLPSETELIQEFGASRPIVVRALEILKTDGWIDSHQGKGRFVRARQAMRGRQLPRYAAELLDEHEGATARTEKLLSAGPVLAPPRAAEALNLAEGTPIVARSRLILDDARPVELSTTYLSVELASGTEVGKAAPIDGSLLRHVARVKGVEFDHAGQGISARHPTAEEAKQLRVRRLDVVLTLLLVVHDRAGTALVCVDAVLPATHHELEDVFPLS
jgi:GntR family transcriptional regulator